MQYYSIWLNIIIPVNINSQPTRAYLSQVIFCFWGYIYPNICVPYFLSLYHEEKYIPEVDEQKCVLLYAPPWKSMKLMKKYVPLFEVWEKNAPPWKSVKFIENIVTVFEAWEKCTPGKSIKLVDKMFPPLKSIIPITK